MGTNKSVRALEDTRKQYKSTGSDKEYFVDALILKATDEDGKKVFSAPQKTDLLKLSREELEKMYLAMFANEIIFETVH